VPIKTQKSSIFQQPRFKTSNKHLPNSTLHPKTIKKKTEKKIETLQPYSYKNKRSTNRNHCKDESPFQNSTPICKTKWKERDKGKNAHFLFFQREKAQAQEITITTTTHLLNYIKSKVFTFNLLNE
jgi:hypothetical protein